MTIALVIDDNRDTADSLCQLLSLLAVEAFPVYGPRAAMLALKKITPDVVFLDVNMPGVDGFEVLAYLRRFPTLTETPVIIVTSDDQPETENKAQEGGALILIIKPATLDSLEAALKQASLIDDGI